MMKLRSWRAMLVALLAVGATLVGVSPASAGGGAGTTKVNTFEKFGFRPGPGGGLVLNYGFAPASVTVPSGSYVRFVDAKKRGEPHTATVVTAADVPKTIDDIFACISPGGLCRKVLKQHFPGPKELRPFINSGSAGYNQPGDSRLILPSTPVLAHVTAPRGTVLHYICVFHPWMQAKITVS